MAKLNEEAENCFEIFKKNFFLWLSIVDYDLCRILTFDGIIKADFWNKDSSRDDVCYNAIRSIPTVIHDTFKTDKVIDIKTRKGIFQTCSKGFYNEYYSL